MPDIEKRVTVMSFTELRDYFAAQAMQAILSSPVEFTLRGEKLGFGESNVAELAYTYADAMIKERNKNNDEGN